MSRWVFGRGLLAAIVVFGTVVFGTIGSECGTSARAADAPARFGFRPRTVNFRFPVLCNATDPRDGECVRLCGLMELRSRCEGQELHIENDWFRIKATGQTSGNKWHASGNQQRVLQRKNQLKAVYEFQTEFVLISDGAKGELRGRATIELCAVLGQPTFLGCLKDCVLEAPAPGGSIRGWKFEDVDGNGTDDGEPRLAGWTIFLDTDGSGSPNGSERSVQTAEDGSYAFTDLPAGQYRVREVQQSGWQQTTTNPAIIDLDPGESFVANTAPAAGETTWAGLAFGNRRAAGEQGTGAVYGQKFRDLDADGEQDAVTNLPTDDEVDNGTLIDNDVPTDVVGHFSIDVGDGGSARTARVTAQGETGLIQDQDFLFEFLNYVDVGSNGGAIDLASTTVTLPATLVAPDVVRSEGTFAGANGPVNWRVESSFANGSTTMINKVTFTSAVPIGNLRFVNYLDEDVGTSVGDDLLYVVGAPGQDDFRAFTLDGPERVGFAQGGFYLAGENLVDAQYAGWAADAYSDLQNAIEGAGANYSALGQIDTSSLPAGSDPELGTVYGPEDVTTAFAWNVNPGATEVTIVTFLDLVALDPAGQEQGLGNVVIRLSRQDAGGVFRVVDTTVTADRDIDGDGSIDPFAEKGLYSFVDLPAGRYRVREYLRSGFRQTTPDPPDFDLIPLDVFVSRAGLAALPPGSSAVERVVPELKFGNTVDVRYALIRGYKFSDEDSSGTDDGEERLSGWRIFLDDGDGVFEPGERSTVTGSDGSYEFQVNPGTYVVREVVRSGWTQTTANPAPVDAIAGRAYLAEPGATPTGFTQVIRADLAFGNHQDEEEPPPEGGFDIVVRFTDDSLTPEQQAVFTAAAARWEQIIRGDIPDVTVPGFGLVDDVVIDATAPAIDGVGGVLGQAGPTQVRTGTFLPARGIMQFDSADVADLLAAGQFDEVILHEMGHVLGIGTIWNLRGLLSGGGTANPQFTGANAVAEYNTLFGTSATSVPVENTGGSGTADGHWRESVFDNELMTGYLNSGVVNPLSRVTVASLADLGYVVDLAAADPYTAPLRAASLRAQSVSPPRGRIRAIPFRPVGTGTDGAAGPAPGEAANPGREPDDENPGNKNPGNEGPGEAGQPPKTGHPPGTGTATPPGGRSQSPVRILPGFVVRPGTGSASDSATRPGTDRNPTTIRPLTADTRSAVGIAPGPGPVAVRAQGAANVPAGSGLVASAPPVGLVPALTAPVPSSPSNAAPGTDPAPAAEPATAERDERTAQGWLALARTLQGRGRNDAARGWLDRIVRELPATRAAPDARRLLEALPPTGR